MPQPRPGPGLREGNDQDLNWLLAHVARGDHGAFEAVYDELAAPVYGVIKKVVRDPAQSEEVVPEIVAAALDRQRVRRCMDGLTEPQNDGLIRLRDCLEVAW